MNQAIMSVAATPTNQTDGFMLSSAYFLFLRLKSERFPYSTRVGTDTDGCPISRASFCARSGVSAKCLHYPAERFIPGHAFRSELNMSATFPRRMRAYPCPPAAQ